MSKIRIKNFGPIKEGFKDDDGNEWMDIKKVTVFIGNQGSGKSTVAKVISTMTWIEKALNRGDIQEPKNKNDFLKHFYFQNLTSYFRNDTVFEYYGDCYNILYNTDGTPNFFVTKLDSEKYIIPKIMYVPSERNFLSIIKKATGVRGLPETLFEFAEELKKGQMDTLGAEVPLPINGVRYKYESDSDTSFIIGEDFKVNLLTASSGFQSLVPLFLVSSTLANAIKNGSEIKSENISVDQSLRMSSELSNILSNNQLNESEKTVKANQIVNKYLNKAFINIVEEPEQNLFPTSQQQMLNSLLDFNNMTEGNKLILTTHSPYLINYLTLAVKAESLLDNSMNYKGKPDFKTAVSKIVPWNSRVRAKDLVIYELNEKDGTIIKLKTYNGLPSDDNYLNDSLAEGNESFGKLIDIEDLCQ